MSSVNESREAYNKVKKKFEFYGEPSSKAKYYT